MVLVEEGQGQRPRVSRNPPGSPCGQMGGTQGLLKVDLYSEESG